MLCKFRTPFPDERDTRAASHRDFDTENRGRCKVFSTRFMARSGHFFLASALRRSSLLTARSPSGHATKRLAMGLASFLCVVVAVLAVVTKAEPSATFVDSRARSTLPMPSSLSTPLFAKKNKKKKGNRAQTTKGFGAPPPTLEERLMSFKNRMPDDDSAPCACGSGRSYTDCCRPFHQGDRQCQTMMDVLR